MNPSTGLPVPTEAAAPAKQLDIGSFIIKIDPSTHDVSLADVLDLIVKVADHPLTYTAEDYVVVFCPCEPEARGGTETAFSFPAGKPRDFLTGPWDRTQPAAASLRATRRDRKNAAVNWRGKDSGTSLSLTASSLRP